VRSAEPGSLAEDWFFQALMECYLPTLKTLETAASDKEQKPKITISLSPTLLSLLEDKDLKKRFPSWLNIRLDLLGNIPKKFTPVKEQLEKNIKNQLVDWEKCEGDLIYRFASLQKSEVVDLMTCAATHGYLPLLRQNPEAVRGQLKTAIREHQRIFGFNPLGIWLPECAFYEGLDQLMSNAGLKYAVLDGHGLLHATPRPRYGLYAPICTKKGVAFFGRDSNSTLPVWSAKEGYPGDATYREFHRDLGWDLPIEKLKSIGFNEPRPLGLKLYKVTSQTTSLENKEIYEPNLAIKKVKEHAKDYLRGRKKQLEILTKNIEVEPLLVAPFDAELFGHWWYEGPLFLSEIFSQSVKEGVIFTRLKDELTNNPKIQLCEPSPSSWGQGGYHHYWLNESNSWVIPEWNKASRAMVKRCSTGVSRELDIRILQQAARELLLCQSSDWSFILRAGTTTELAKERINRHLGRFWDLMKIIEKEEEYSTSALEEIEKEDCLFPLIQANDWCEIL
tara:strand:+ start:4620 stop:6137 length:1518 start_codon:yes stop_codon:yes gene_type:complete